MSESSNYSLRDKEDKQTGLIKIETKEKSIILKNNLIFVDSRDCIGLRSLEDSQNYSQGRGLRPASFGRIINIINVTPIVLIIDKTVEEARIKNGDRIILSDIDRVFVAANASGNSFALFGTYTDTLPNNYTGNWTRPADTNYPMLENFNNTIINNVMTVRFNKRLRLIKSITLINSIIPRDLIPLPVYLSDFINTSCKLPVSSPGSSATYIPQNRNFLETQILGLLSTPIELFRTYINGSYSMPASVTPFPLNLWDPLIGAWPLQPKPYPYQTVPTYQSNSITISNETAKLVLSGYGVYDFKDFSKITLVSIPIAPFTIDIGRMFANIARKLLLLLITPIQSQVGTDGGLYDYIDLIFHSNTTSNNVFPYGYGDYQRFVPGPGLQMNYNPGTSDSASPTVAGVDNPIAFPLFRGNVFGPYDTPGDRFQKLGLLQTIQDLYLNGDLRNLYGDPIIKQDVTCEQIMDNPTFGLNFDSLRVVTLDNIDSSTNLNIMNAMRIKPNGFGTTNIIASGNGNNVNYQNTYQNGGGQGPSPQGPPSAGGGGWTDNGLGYVAGSGNATFTDPIAEGWGANFTTYTGITVGAVPEGVDATISGSETVAPLITSRVAWTVSLEPVLLIIFEKWKRYLIQELSETNIILKITNGAQDLSKQGTNSKTYDAILSLPMRLNLALETGSVKYLEAIQTLMANSDEYWTKRFGAPISSMESMQIEFLTYAGEPIPIEKMLQERRSIDYLRIYERLYSYDQSFNTDELSFLYDPLNPQLNNRTKRNISLIFRFENYEYSDPGLEIRPEDLIDNDRSGDYLVRASNYGNYS